MKNILHEYICLFLVIMFLEKYSDDITAIFVIGIQVECALACSDKALFNKPDKKRIYTLEKQSNEHG